MKDLFIISLPLIHGLIIQVVQMAKPDYPVGSSSMLLFVLWIWGLSEAYRAGENRAVRDAKDYYRLYFKDNREELDSGD